MGRTSRNSGRVLVAEPVVHRRAQAARDDDLDLDLGVGRDGDGGRCCAQIFQIFANRNN